VTVTYDRYGHLMPGNEDEAAALLDAYLDRADTQARAAQLRHTAYTKFLQTVIFSGGGGIRTHEAPLGAQRFSRPPLSTAQAPRRPEG
jgi:hypothetical protein